jgi:hypothetical protein
MTLPSIINQNAEGNRIGGSNPSTATTYHYNDLRRDSNTAVITEPKKAHYQQLNLISRGGYELGPEAYIYHPDPAVSRMWGQQLRASK